MKRILAPVAALGAMVLCIGLWVGAAPDGRAIYAIERPAPSILEALARRHDLDVRWVERGLVLFEAAPGIDVPTGSRFVANRPLDRSLGLLRASVGAQWNKADAESRAVVRFLDSMRVARLNATAGEMWVLLAEPGSWPHEIGACHGGLVLPPSRIDPRAALDRGPTAALQSYLRRGVQALTPVQRGFLADVSADSLYANVERLSMNGALLANRFVFSPDLDGIYAPRVEAAMQRAVAGIPGAVVERRAFPMRRTSSQTLDAHNIVARIPGSVPGTGTFVVCGHVDATGSSDPTWRATVQQGGEAATPGAEDNASGVACVLETLRCIADGIRTGSLDFAFDLEFVAFSGEERTIPPSPEQLLEGSKAYVADALDDGETLLAVWNYDMVGYDSIPGNLQIAHNPASRFLAETIRDAATTLVPPSPLHVTLEIDETLVSDHNSFWAANVPGILASDASSRIVRQYRTYHRPLDQAPFVLPNKLAEVTRIVMAGLMQFDVNASTGPELLFGEDDLELRRRIGDLDTEYRNDLHRLYPGAPLFAALAVHSVGQRYEGPVHIQLETRGAVGGTDAFYDRNEPDDLPPGDRIDLLVPVPIRSQDLGWRELVARVTWRDSLGADVAMVQVDSFHVDANSQGGLDVSVAPNPTNDPAAALLRFDLQVPGDLIVDVYDLEGEKIASSTRPVTPRVTSTRMTLPLLTADAGGGLPGGIASGAYVVVVRWRGSDGSSAQATTHMVVQR